MLLRNASGIPHLLDLWPPPGKGEGGGGFLGAYSTPWAQFLSGFFAFLKQPKFGALVDVAMKSAIAGSRVLGFHIIASEGLARMAH